MLTQCDNLVLLLNKTENFEYNGEGQIVGSTDKVYVAAAAH